MLVTSIFSFSQQCFQRLLSSGVTESRDCVVKSKRDFRGREVECRPPNLDVPSSIPGSGCQLWDFSIDPHIRLEYWCSSQEAESESKENKL